MTAEHDQPRSGLDRDNNERADVNQEAKEQSSDTTSMHGDATKERMQELTDAAKDDAR